MPKPGEEDWRGSIITDEGINRDLPNPVIIPKPGKVAVMIWIVKHFQTLLMSALIAESR